MCYIVYDAFDSRLCDDLPNFAHSKQNKKDSKQNSKQFIITPQSRSYTLHGTKTEFAVLMMYAIATCTYKL